METAKPNLTDNAKALHTEELYDIISSPPSWLIRWGIIIFFLLLVTMLSLTVIIKYPDVIKTSMKVDALNPPIPVFSICSGRVTNIMVHEHQSLTKGQSMIIIEPAYTDGRVAGSPVAVLAPASGQVLFTGLLNQGQNVRAGQGLFYIEQPEPGYYGEIQIPQATFGKIKVGQEVLIKLDSYPYQEYGMLKGFIEFISVFPNNNNVYIGKVSILKNAGSDKINDIKLKPGMVAEADIVTEKLSLFHRLTENALKLIK